MSGKKIRIEQSLKPLKAQPNKTNGVREDGIEKIPQSQEKLDSSKLHYPGKGFRFSKTMFGNQNRSCLHEWFKKCPWLDYDITSKSVTYYFYKHQHSLDNLKAEPLKENTFLDKGFDHWKKALPKFDKHTRSHCR